MNEAVPSDDSSSVRRIPAVHERLILLGRVDARVGVCIAADRHGDAVAMFQGAELLKLFRVFQRRWRQIRVSFEKRSPVRVYANVTQGFHTAIVVSYVWDVCA